MGGMQVLGTQDGFGNLSSLQAPSTIMRETHPQFRQQDSSEIRRQVGLILQSNIREIWMGSHYTPWHQVYGSTGREAKPKALKETGLSAWTDHEREILTRMIGLFASGDPHFAARHDEIYGPR
jgi:hypothetical protein